MEQRPPQNPAQQELNTPEMPSRSVSSYRVPEQRGITLAQLLIIIEEVSGHPVMDISSNEDKYRLLIYYRNDQLLSTEPYINQTIDVCVAQREEAARDNAAFETLRRRREQGNINARRFSPGKAKRVANGGIEYSAKCEDRIFYPGLWFPAAN